jgi:hypothetical protein
LAIKSPSPQVSTSLLPVLGIGGRARICASLRGFLRIRDNSSHKTILSHKSRSDASQNISHKRKGFPGIRRAPVRQVLRPKALRQNSLRRSELSQDFGKTERVGFDLKITWVVLERIGRKRRQSHPEISQNISQKQTRFTETGWDAMGQGIMELDGRLGFRLRCCSDLRMPHPTSAHHPSRTSRRGTQ